MPEMITPFRPLASAPVLVAIQMEESRPVEIKIGFQPTLG